MAEVRAQRTSRGTWRSGASQHRHACAGARSNRSIGQSDNGPFAATRAISTRRQFPEEKRMNALAGSVPILTCDEARALETKLFEGDEAQEWSAMQRAGDAVAEAVLCDAREIGGFPPDGRLLLL